MNNMSETYTRITEPGIAPPRYDPRYIKGTDFHREMLTVASNNFAHTSITFTSRLRNYIIKFWSRYRLLRYKQFFSHRYAPLKLLNFTIFLLERRRVDKVHYLPFHASLEVCSFCNLRCPGCTTGLRDSAARKQGKTSLEKMKHVIDQLAKSSVQMNLFNNGEPLLNEMFYAACAYAAQKGLWTEIDTNLNIRDDKLAEKIIGSKLHKLTISCDGATQQVYEKYRRGGDVDLVFDNLQRIAAEKKKRDLVFPWITAKFVVFDHNWHECRLFREKALACGADEVLFAQAGMGGFYKTGRVSTAKVFNLRELRWETPPPKACDLIWDTFIIDYDGGLYPCCICYRDDDLFVTPQDADRMPLIEQWNVEKYRAVRSFFLGKATAAMHKLPQPCNTCRRCADHVKLMRDEKMREVRGAEKGGPVE